MPETQEVKEMYKSQKMGMSQLHKAGSSRKAVSMSQYHAEESLGAMQLPLSHLCSVNKPNAFINLPLDSGRTATLAPPSGLNVCPRVSKDAH